MRNYMTTLNPFFDQLLFGSKNFDSKLMRTNIKETKDNYQIIIELPEVTKENIKVALKDGTLTVSASIKKEEEEESRYLLRERFEGTYSRSYYVGEEVKLSDISAKLNNGILTLTINKVKEEEKPEEQFVDIE